jgi:mercuric ion transport protein
MIDRPMDGRERGVAAVGTLASLSALFSSAACCVLPLALASAGLGVGGLAAVVPYRWPLTGFALVMLAAGWVLYLRKRRACAADPSCAGSPPGRATLIMLCVATLATALSASWKLFEQPLMRALGG